ncbi:MAG: hypothetical protein R3264_01125 [Anaerolineae bacterium]|nr:hypothetical protein [Anaerolineae bacterium]
MGRKIDTARRKTVLQAIEENDGQQRIAGLARILNRHPQEITRTLAALEDEEEKWVFEDDKGFLSIYRKK